ncbi:hypothetical protein VP01_1565g2 [Puccinia sorghi]|uniref:Uncharacterized protein n=1 Tax=Puccinia sorghi TaxID=27349 RepID=A0A0L6VJS6_9BASI|nr:hypothetical protein VP01_1565g2 [Puccinia sorghi]
MADLVPTTIEEWEVLRQTVHDKATLTHTRLQTIELRICAGLTFASGLLYALSFLKRRSRGAWIFQKDVEGYWHPNVHTSLPIFAVLYAILDVSAVVFVETNVGHPISPVPVALQLVAYQTLQVFAWSKNSMLKKDSLFGNYLDIIVWAVLYALLFSHQRSPPNAIHSSKARRLVSPRIFNLFNLLIIIIILAGQAPMIYFLCTATHEFRRQASATDQSFQLVFDVSQSDDTNNALYDAALQTFLDLRLLKHQAANANMLFKVYTIVLIVCISFSTIAYLVSTSVLLHALASQKNFLTSALDNRRALRLIQHIEQDDVDSRHSITSWIIQSLPSSPTGFKHETSTKSKLFPPHTWRSWVDYANDESLNGQVFWDRTHQLKTTLHASSSTLGSECQVDRNSGPIGCLSDAALEKHCSTLIRYWYSTLGQTIIGLGMFGSYLVIAGWLLSGGARSTGQEGLMKAFVWSNWTWGGGLGFLLGVVACIVAFSPTPKLPSDVKANKQASSSKVELSKQKSLGPNEGKSSRGGPLEMKILYGEKATNQRGGAKMTAGHESQQREDVSDENSEWGRRPSTDPLNQTENTNNNNNKSCLERQPSNSSTYSSYSQATLRHDFLRSPSNDHLNWLKPENTQSENLVQEEWVAGHFKAIQRLRMGLRRDSRFSRPSQRARSRIL